MDTIVNSSAVSGISAESKVRASLVSRALQNTTIEGKPTPQGYGDFIVTNTRVDFSFFDRIRILLTGRASFRSFTYCQYFAGETDTKAQVTAGKFKQPY